MEIEVSDIVSTYKELALIPSPTSAILRPNHTQNILNIHSTWSIPDLVRLESTKFTRDFLLEYNSEKFKVLSHGLPCDASSVSLQAFSKSGKRHAVLRKVKKSGEDSIYLEIWNSLKKERTFDMSDCKEHGKIQDTGSFGSLEWSTNENYLIYIAEVKKKKSESFFKDVFCQNNEESTKESCDQKEAEKGEENLYEETWGESYTTVHHTVLCIFNVETGKVEVLNLDDKYPNVSVAQATWGPNDDSIVFVGYNEAPFRLGLIYCSNRSSAIYSYDLQSKVIERLTDEENVCVEFPVFSPNFEALIFLQNKAGGPHQSCRKLMKYDWKTKQLSTLIDIVENANAVDFAGFYVTNLSSKWWSSDSRFFFFHTFRRSFQEIFCVDLLTSKVQRIGTDSSWGSCSVLDVKDPYILAAVSSPSIAPSLMIGYFSSVNDKIHVSWTFVDENSHLELQDLKWNVHTLTPCLPNKTYPNLDYDIIVLSSKKKNGTLIIFPHGGPHSLFFPNFSVYISAFARLGYIVCEVNYRGSVGFGENSIKSLLGNIGSQDVSDVTNAIEYLKKDKALGIQHVVGFGGSHGGFLIAHLLGQYPDLLKAAAIRNPVIDLTCMVGLSDIPDWGWIESGICDTYEASKTLDPSQLQDMWEKSPIKYIKDVKSPTLLCLGKNDLRVPSLQGLLFYRYLKTQNVPVKVFYYDDNHALSKVAVSSDAFVQIAMWFQMQLTA